jgi:DNA-binding NarL/FixJ family response regulator
MMSSQVRFSKHLGVVVKIVLATADTHLQISLGLSLSEEPGAKIVGTASDTKSLAALIRITQPHIVVTDWCLKGEPVQELIVSSHEQAPVPRWVVIGTTDVSKEKVLQSGADAFVVQGDSPDILLQAFRRTRAQLRSDSGRHLSSSEED